MTFNDSTIQRILLEKRLLTKEQIELAVLLAPSLGKSFADTIIFKNLLPQETLGKVLAEALGVEYANLKGRIIAPEVLNLIPEDSAIASQMVAFEKTDTRLSLALTDPTNFETINFVEKKTGLIVQPFFTFYDQIVFGLGQYKKDINAEFQKIITQAKGLAGNLSKAAEEVPTVRMLDTIMEYAVAKGASDIHIEELEHNALIRFRVDGILHDILVLDRAVQPLLIARIKYLCNLKIDEHRLPQDGRFKYESQNKSAVAVRVSIIPTFYGENVAMRLLPETTKTQTLAELGFNKANINVLTQQIKRTNGIILVTGPTGSGKSTTLYSVLEMLNRTEIKISTIEDPIEYSIPRVTQSQVNIETGFTFATGLRSLLRHDPNIIMVGEIRDKETADISINAALTGHLVLSTLHTNDSTSSMPRLMDLGVEPFLITATVRAVVAQRLIRKLCQKCAQPLKLTDDEIRALAKVSHYTYDSLRHQHFKQSRGCSDCTLGFKGRMGIHELFVVTEDMRNVILNHADNDKLREVAIKNGMKTLFQDGVEKAAAGLTTLEEVFREAGGEEDYAPV
jgi:type IV pilus assembly protein PilB